MSIDEVLNSAENEHRPEARDRLSRFLQEGDPNGYSWIEKSLNQLSSVDIGSLLSMLNETLHATRRVVTKRFVIVSFSERMSATTESLYGKVPIGRWRQHELAQIYLISQVMTERYTKEQRFAELYRLYDASDTEGRVACLRSLNFMLGLPEDALKMIHDAGRTYLSDLMEAAWCDHPYASQNLSIEELRKAVMKALFCQVSIEGIMGIDRIADPELSRRLIEFADEREAAGRTVPAEVWRVASYFPVPGLVARLIGKLEHPMREERLNAAICLGRAKEFLAIPFITDRIDREDDSEVEYSLRVAIEHIKAEK